MENKEFEKYWKNPLLEELRKRVDNEDYYESEVITKDFEKVFYDAYKLGKEQERDKHRWIPVNERFPTENDGPKSWVQLRFEKKYRYNCVSIITCDTKGRRGETSFDLDANKFLCIIDPIIKWQPIPEE